ncbi:vWA domain-containing protein [Sorangium sp. So ce131]|uniref:vWA domain-containing protein n=1 Tax=Sorangium sp. So ce131 TaxID=3133282 RepID=UPI003F61032E
MAIALLTVGAIGTACGSSGTSDVGGSAQNSGGSGSGTGSGAGDTFGGDVGPGGSGGSGAGSGDGGSCATQSAEADLEPVYLAFAFDVSGSMGMGDLPWYDKTLKWDPVVAATKQFFADPESQGIRASLTFFPSDDEDNDIKCSVAPYATPAVPMTLLPSPAFAAAIDEITPQTMEEWRGGTPTLFVMQGTIGFVEQQRQAVPGKYAIVLVTDGEPAGCGPENNAIQRVVDEAAGALTNLIPTYVIGVANPPHPDAPTETIGNMSRVAEAGGTERAFLIDTGDPEATTAAFKAAVDAIRGGTVSCTVAIPPAPDGRTFDEQRVRVTYRSGNDAPTALTYDQECEADNAWRYDNPQSPAQIVLCESACAAIQADPQAALGVDFTCEDVIVIPR